MSDHAALQRAQLLMQQGRLELAEKELGRLLGAEPENAPAHALLAYVLLERGEPAAALAQARSAVGHDPDLPFAHHALAVVLLHGGEPESATQSAHAAIRLDPDDADHYALFAQIAAAQKRWQAMLGAADAGLERDAAHVDCLNLRAMALVRLGRSAEADASLEASLGRDPHNPHTHQAQGWALLHKGDGKAAVEHFREALRLDPELDHARAGLVEALKARNPLYRVLLRWFLWLERFTAGKQRQILVGAWLVVFVGRRVLASIGESGAAFWVGAAWLGVVLLTACLSPFFDLLLLLHPLGRHALPAHKRLDALCLGGALVLLLALAVASVCEAAPWAYPGLWFALVYLLPVAGIGSVRTGWPRRVMQGLSGVLLLGFVWWVVEFERSMAQWRSWNSSDEHFDRLLWLILPSALSTWFVLFASGRRRGR